MLILLLTLLLKFFGIWIVYYLPLPNRYPPDVSITKIGYCLYLLINKTTLFLNNNIPAFPSKLVFFIQQENTKALFLKLPFILLDIGVCLLFVLAIIKKQKNIKIFIFGLINFWFLFYFYTNRLSVFEETFNIIFNPFKVSPEGRMVILTYFVIFLLSIVHLAGFKKLVNNTKKLLRKNSQLIKIIISVFILIMVINYLGIFKTFSKNDNVLWKGYWIKPDGLLNMENQYLVYEKEFNLIFKPKKAHLYLQCQSDYILYINGKKIGRGGLISPKNYYYYENWEVANHLKRGKNSIRIDCYNPYLDTLSLIKNQTALLFQFEAENGLLKTKIVSDNTWNAYIDCNYQQKVNFVSVSSGFQEFYNENCQSAKKVAQIIDRPDKKNLLLRPIPPLAVNKLLPLRKIKYGFYRENKISDNLAITINEGNKKIQKTLDLSDLPFNLSEKDSFLIFDFEKIIVGYPHILGNFTTGGTLFLGFSETLKNDGTPDLTRMITQADGLTIKAGEIDYIFRQKRAFRYLILIVSDPGKGFFLKEMSVDTQNYPADDSESYLITSDDMINKIYLISKYTAKIARQGNFEDCPHRERAQYVGDLRIVSLVNYYNYSDKNLVKKALKEFSYSQDELGFINAVYPSGRKLIIPDYSAQWISAVWEYYLYTGDKKTLTDLYPYLIRQMEGFNKFSDNDGLIKGQIYWWTFIDQGDQENNNDKSISFNLFYLNSLYDLIMIAGELGKTSDVIKYTNLADKVKLSINQKSYNSGIGLYDDCLVGDTKCGSFSRQTNSLALLSGIIPVKEKTRLINQLLYNQKMPQIITPYFNTFVAEAFFTNGYNQEGLSLIKKYWGAMVNAGATNFWETYDPVTGKESGRYGESLSHGWSSGPAYLLPKWVLGITPVKADFKEFSIKPLIDYFDYVKGKIPIDKDEFITVSWDKKDNKELNISYNFDGTAELFLPIYYPEINQDTNINLIRSIDGYRIYQIRSPGDYRVLLN